jgi:hypothetical protein
MNLSHSSLLECSELYAVKTRRKADGWNILFQLVSNTMKDGNQAQIPNEI